MADQRPDQNPPPPEEKQPHWSKRIEWVWALLIGGAVTLALFYLMVFNQEAEETSEPPAGWDELEACGTMRSIDGMRQLQLRRDQAATVTDLSPAKEGESQQRKPIETRWDYDSQAERYAIVIGERKDVYSLMKMQSPPVCILLKGDAGSADLNSSWFAIRNVRQDENNEQSDE
jgi:hypothetical protein